MFSREHFENKRFFDYDRFPYGLSRCGDFSINESKFIEDQGMLLKALIEGQVTNPNKHDLHMIQVAKGEVEAKTFEEKTWLKYVMYKGRNRISLSDSTKDDDDDDFYDDDDSSSSDDDYDLIDSDVDNVIAP